MTQNKKLLIRADSSSFIGYGHVMRCLVLAKHFYKEGYIITFASLNLKGSLNDKIKELYDLKILPDSNIETLIVFLKEENFDLLIIDNYDIDYFYEKKIKDEVDIKLFCLDDNYNKHYCDELLNHNIYAQKQRYLDLVPSNCQLYCGRKYTLLRDEFYKQKKYNGNKNILIALGGVDSMNLSQKVFALVKKFFPKLKIDLITTNGNKNLNSLKKLEKKNENLNLHINSSEIAKLMNNCSFAVVTPSVILNELFFFNKPFIAIKTVSNQEEMYKYLKNNRYYVLKEFSHLQMKKKLNLIRQKL